MFRIFLEPYHLYLQWLQKFSQESGSSIVECKKEKRAGNKTRKLEKEQRAMSRVSVEEEPFPKQSFMPRVIHTCTS